MLDNVRYPYILPDMQRNLNATKAQRAMEKANLTQTAVARQLGASGGELAGWLKGRDFPPPNKLLQLGKLLNLSFDELVVTDDPYAPKVAFRKMKGTKTKDHHIWKAQEMGRYLRQLAPYLPFDTLKMPPVLKSPSCNYDYLHTVTSQVRKDIDLGPTEKVDFTHLIRHFGELQTVMVPVLWGAKQRHENAVHIYLPDSHSTWVYLNLDTNHHDFKFWMAHELGHCLSPSLIGEEAEDFADAFSGALLYPHELAERAYRYMKAQSSISAKTDYTLKQAKRHIISPHTIVKRVEEYAKAAGKPEIDMGTRFDGVVTNFNKSYKNLSEALFKDAKRDNEGRLSACEYIDKAESAFKTPFFGLLRQHLKEHDKGPGFVQTVLDMPPLDARSIHAELTHGSVKNPC